MKLLDTILGVLYEKEKRIDLALLFWIIACAVSYYANVYIASPIFLLSGYIAMQSGKNAKFFFGSALFFLVLIIPMTGIRNFNTNFLAHSLLFLFLGAALQIAFRKLGGNRD